MPRAAFLVRDAQPFLRGETQHTNFSDLRIVVHPIRGLAGLGQGIGLRQEGMDGALADQAIGLPGFSVVGKVRADDALLVHPQIAVVILVIIAAGGSAGDDLPPRAGNKDARRKGFMTRMLIHHIRVFAARHIPNLLAKAAQFAQVLRPVFIPELVTFRIPINHPARADGFA